MILAVCLSLLVCQLDAKPKPSIDRGQIVARVGSKVITLADIDLQLGRSSSADGSLKELPVAVKLATIHLIAQQLQSLETLKNSNSIVASTEVDHWLEETYPSGDQKNGAQIARAKALDAGVSEASFRELLQWRLSWQKYLNLHLTPTNLKKQFQNQPSRFDGTRFSIEHLFIPTLPGKSAQRSAARVRLDDLRSQLTSGELTFQNAASQLQSEKLSDGKFGPMWIGGNGPLHPGVVDATIKLDSNEISPVFDSPAGVHLVRLIAKEPGTKQLEDVTDDVRRHMLLHLLEFSANQSARDMPLTVLESATLKVPQ